MLSWFHDTKGKYNVIALSLDVLFAAVVPFFFICFGMLWVAFKIIDFIKKKKG